MSRWNGISGSGTIRGGTGKTHHVDRAIGCKQPRKNVQQAKTHEPTKRLRVDAPVSVHLPFKTACSAAHHQMFAEQLHLIEAPIYRAGK